MEILELSTFLLSIAENWKSSKTEVCVKRERVGLRIYVRYCLIFSLKESKFTEFFISRGIKFYIWLVLYGIAF